ncbi:MAG: hypothetical protein JRJ84_06400 [Deltaproteobacteria bacterium]|nr:hypothetical protein [Deltaproteobacteria bacterium]
MAPGRLQLLGPYDAWHGAAHVGRFTMEGAAAQPVLVLLGPESKAPDAVDRAKQAAEAARGIHHPGVLRLLAVESFGERVAWVYQEMLGMGLGHTVGGENEILLPTRVAAQTVGRVAQTLLDLGTAGTAHNGPEASDLLVDSFGNLYVAGFSGPFPRSPSMRAPQGDDGEAALVYRLGVLLALLVSGSSPAPPSNRAAHAAVIRRALIRAMSRPGPVLTERYGDWLRGMLAWEPSERPPLSTVPDGLAKVAEATAGPSLEEWCLERVEALRQRVILEAEQRRHGTDGAVLARAHSEAPPNLGTDQRSFETRRLAPVTPSPTPAPVVRRPPTAQVAKLEAALPEDDPTQESSAEDEPELIDSKPPIRVTSLLPMPVQVGPPPEAVRTRPSLPPGFLEASADRTDPSAPVSGMGDWLHPAHTLWVAGGVLGMLALVLLGINLVLWGRSTRAEAVPVVEPSIEEIISDPGAATDSEVLSHDPFAVWFVGPSGREMDVQCGSQFAKGIGKVQVDGLGPGRCLVFTTTEKGPLRAEVLVEGPATYRCFDADEPRCN